MPTRKRKRKWIPRNEQERRIDSLDWRQARDRYETDNLSWERRMSALLFDDYLLDIAQDYLNNPRPITEELLKRFIDIKSNKKAHKDYLTRFGEQALEHWVPSTYDEYYRRNQEGNMRPPRDIVSKYDSQNIDAAIDRWMWSNQRASNIMDSLVIEQHLPYYDDPKIRRKVDAILEQIERNRVQPTYPGYDKVLERRNEPSSWTAEPGSEPEYKIVLTPHGYVSRPIDPILEW